MASQAAAPDHLRRSSAGWQVGPRRSYATVTVTVRDPVRDLVLMGLMPWGLMGLTTWELLRGQHMGAEAIIYKSMCNCCEGIDYCEESTARK